MLWFLALLDQLPPDLEFPVIAECSICGQPFARKRDLRRHLLAEHFSSDSSTPSNDLSGDGDELDEENDVIK